MRNTDCRKCFFLLVIVIALLIGTSCAKPVVSARIIPDSVGKEDRIESGPLYRSISVENVQGGKETHPMMFSEIGNPALKEAITESLRGNNYLSENGGVSKYGLNVVLLEIDCPSGGFTKTVTTFVRYKIVGKQNGDVLFDDIRKSKCSRRYLRNQNLHF